MASQLYKNMVYEWTDEVAPKSIYRLLWLEHGSSYVWAIRVFDRKAQPVRVSRDFLEDSIERGQARILTKDPYAHLQRLESNIKEEHRKKRDEAWSIISSAIEDGSDTIYQFYARNSPLRRALKKAGCSTSRFYRMLRRYFQRGQIRNALLPLYNNCGSRNRLPTHKKLGRRTKLALASGKPTGINITEQIRQLFRNGIKLFYEIRKRPKLSFAFQETLERFFNLGYEEGKDGELVPIMPPDEDLPTLHQFRYWYKKERRPRRAQTARDGLTRHDLTGRAKLGRSTQLAFGPGSIYQIDATVGDVYLVSSLNRNWIIGRPIIYFIIDLFSRLIVGLSVTLEGPSWLGAMLALENAVTNKVAFCAEYGISIKETDWPVHHLPEGIFADRGEFEGYNADQLVNAFGINVYNTAPYRADLKGVVEQHFDRSNEKVIHWLPGRVRKRERGDRDYRLDATLDLSEFRRIMILAALDHNAQHRLDNYPLEADMIADGLEPYPIDLWNWGLRHRTGCLREKDIDTVRMNLLPQAEASVTQNGILFSNLYYTSDYALKRQWPELAGESGRWKIPIVHDPRSRNRIYLRLDNGKRLEVCHLVEAEDTFRDRDWYETLDEFELRAQRKQGSKTRHIRSRARFHASTRAIVTRAHRKNADARDESSNNARISGIRGNRRKERELERTKQAWEFGPGPKTPNVDRSTRGSHYVPPPQPTDKLRKIRERMLKNEPRSEQ